MTKIKVDLNAFYGYGHGGCSYGSDETIEIEVNEQEFKALRKLGEKKVSCEAVVKAIENGESVLESLHEKLEEKFYYMVEEYWLYEADNECLEECLAEHIEQDISDGLYTPVITKNEDEDEEREEDCEEEEDDDWDEEPEYDLEVYYAWVCGNGHDHAFVAERVGLDLYACHDDEVNYTIHLAE